MKVLVPQHRPELFITEIIKSYETHVDVHTSFQDFWLNDGNYDIIHLHWPEYLFKWEVPTDLELLLLERVLREWHQKGAKIVVTRHNYLPHRPNPELFIPLYNLVYAHAHAVIHMGHHSEQEYLERYKELIPQKQLQVQIPHPIFTNYPNHVSKDEARKHLNINKNTLVMLVFGEVRKAVEKNLVLTAFKNITTRDKLLLVPGWKFSEGKEPVNTLKWFKVKHSKRYRVFNEFIEDDAVQYYFKAADFVFLPRVDTLNSGVPYLAAVFNTPVVGAKTGNIGEFFEVVGMPIFIPDDDASLADVLNEVLTKETFEPYAAAKSHCDLKVIGEQHRDLFIKLID